MLFYENLEEIIFHRHENFLVDELIILSGYVGPKPIRRLEELDIKSSVIYGMYGSEKISKHLHDSLCELETRLPDTQILYSTIPVHSKCYIWRNSQEIVTALIGSANFSVSGLHNPYKEILAETSRDTFSPLQTYLNRIIDSSLNCLDPSVQLKGINNMMASNRHVTFNVDVCSASLLDRTGNVPERSGLNWGLSPSHVTLGDAYIAIKKNHILCYPNLFPPKQYLAINIASTGRTNRQNDAIELIWDDGTQMEGVLEQTQVVNNVMYPKALCSSPNKNELGKYIRSRLGVSLNHLITRQDLENYGRTSVDISLLGEGIYYLDFSPRR